jgi:uncharacterized protein (TIGR03790 family)
VIKAENSAQRKERRGLFTVQSRQNMRLFSIILATGTMAATGSAVTAKDGGEEVVVVYNSAMPESKAVADHYVKLRNVPTNHVFGFKLSAGCDMPRAEYQNDLLRPFVAALKERHLVAFGPVAMPGTNGRAAQTQRRITEAKFRYVVLCYGVPWRILPDTSLIEPEAEKIQPEMRRNEAAVDSELACLAICERPYSFAGPITNPAYTITNATAMHPTNGIVMVTRLDAPSAEIARGLVDKALEAERDGMWGRAYFDLRGNVEPGMKQGEDWLRGAAELCRMLGFETVVDTNEAVFSAGFPMSQIAFYAGWYRQDVCGPFALPRVEFMPGAFAYHLHSFSASNLRSTNQSWVGPFLAKGVTITMGCVHEPYLSCTPDIAVFSSRLIYGGFSFGEAAYAAQNALSWQTTVVGDPLYRPFGRSPQALHQDLEDRKSPLIEWSHLRLANLNLASGAPLANVVELVESVPAVRHSPMLMEKLGDLYAAQGKPSSSAWACEQALKLATSPPQRIRLSLNLADRLTALGRESEATVVLEKLLADAPDYPDKPSVERKLVALTQKLGKARPATK